MHNFIDLTGKVFGRLTVICRDLSVPRAEPYWSCQCICGSSKSVCGSNLRKGHTQSCGCLHREQLTARNTKHGSSTDDQYFAWKQMLSRCSNPENEAYKNYGGRGITVCARWEDYTNFVADMGERPDGCEIDRRDNSLGYYKENCHWTTRKTNNNNKRNNALVLYQGDTMTLAQAAELSGVPYRRLMSRRQRGWPLEHLFAPAGARLAQLGPK